MPTITYSYSQNPDADKGAAAIKASLEKAGIKVKLNPIEASAYYTTIFDKSRATELMNNGWGPDWPNASTVIPPIFTEKGGWDVSRVNDKAYNAKVDAALSETDRTKQAELWKALNKEAMAAGLGRSRRCSRTTSVSLARRSTRPRARTARCTSAVPQVTGPTSTCTSRRSR